MSERRRRLLLGVLQVALLGAALWFLIATARTHWSSVRQFDLRPSWPPLIAGSLLTIATYLYLVAAWKVSLGWWRAELGYLAALRMYFVTNLARFIPGAVWQFVGLSAMAVAERISPVAATGGVLLQQLVLLATGLAIAVVGAPELFGGWTHQLPSAALVALAIGGLLAFVLVIPALAPAIGRIGERALRRQFSWPDVSGARFAVYVAGLVVPWVTYGIGFWLFARAFLADAAPSVALALPAYTASYVAGLIAVLAPGGILVREAALVGALAPHIGAQAALFLAIGARLWLLILELLTAAGVLIAHRLRRREVRDA